MHIKIRPVVVPRAGTWIETAKERAKEASDAVVPRAGTWIETAGTAHSLLMIGVVPRAGTWIETVSALTALAKVLCRSPCGNVD